MNLDYNLFDCGQAHDNLVLRPEFYYQLIYGNCFSDLGSGGGDEKK